jgi:predicted Zn-ribbon and HTH transcriptional regulator
MTVEKIAVLRCKCDKCGHRWTTKTDKAPKTCPSCKNPNWNRKVTKPADRISSDYYDDYMELIDIEANDG